MLRLVRCSMDYEDSLHEYTLHSGCWMNSGLKIGFSFYSYTLNIRLILGLYPAVELLPSHCSRTSHAKKRWFMPTAGVCSWGLRVSERDNAKLWGSNMGASLGHETPFTQPHSSSHSLPPFDVWKQVLRI